MLFVKRAGNRAGAYPEGLRTAGEKRFFRQHDHQAGKAAARPLRMDIEAMDLLVAVGAESSKPSALPDNIGEEKGFIVAIHCPDIARRFQAAGPAFQFGAAVERRGRAADRFLVDVLDGGRIARSGLAEPKPARQALANLGGNSSPSGNL